MKKRFIWIKILEAPGPKYGAEDLERIPWLHVSIAGKGKRPNAEAAKCWVASLCNKSLWEELIHPKSLALIPFQAVYL